LLCRITLRIKPTEVIISEISKKLAIQCASLKLAGELYLFGK
jgi:hypothetical protein